MSLHLRLKRRRWRPILDFPKYRLVYRLQVCGAYPRLLSFKAFEKMCHVHFPFLSSQTIKRTHCRIIFVPSYQTSLGQSRQAPSLSQSSDVNHNRMSSLPVPLEVLQRFLRVGLEFLSIRTPQPLFTDTMRKAVAREKTLTLCILLTIRATLVALDLLDVFADIFFYCLQN